MNLFVILWRSVFKKKTLFSIHLRCTVLFNIDNSVEIILSLFWGVNGSFFINDALLRITFARGKPNNIFFKKFRRKDFTKSLDHILCNTLYTKSAYYTARFLPVEIAYGSVYNNIKVVDAESRIFDLNLRQHSQ